MSKINKVLYNVNQRDSDPSKGNTREEMWMARHNIGLDEVIGCPTVIVDGKEYTGIAPLGKNGLVPAEYLPSYVDAVIDGYAVSVSGVIKFYEDPAHTQEIAGEEGYTYVDITYPDVGIGYRWTEGSGFFQISSQNAFGALKAGNDTIHADQPMDLLTIAGESGITVTVADTRDQEQNGSDKLTIKHSNSIVAGRIGEDSPTTQINNTFNLPWASFDAQGHITATGSNAITIKNATTGQYGVTKLTSTPDEDDESLAMTPKGVQAAIAALDANVGSTGGTNVALTVTEADGVITGVSITKDDTAKASHAHGNITSDGKVTTAAASKKGILITNSSDQVVTGPAFGTASGDDALFLNKQGNWSGINEATTSALGGIKIGYTKNATKYPVELSDGKAYVDVPCSEITLWKGSSSGSVHQNLMTIYEGSSTGALASIAFNNENSTVTMVKKPTTGDGGKVLTVTEPGGSVAPYYEWKEMPFPAVVQTYHNGIDTSYTWNYTGVSSNFSKAAVTITGLDPNKLHTVEFDMCYSQNLASSREMYVFASASESNNNVPLGYSRLSTLVGEPVDGKYPRLINCSWTLTSSSNGEIFINIAGNASPDAVTNKVTLHDVNYTVTRLK